MSPIPAPLRRTPRPGSSRRTLRLGLAGAATALLATGCDARSVYNDAFRVGFPSPVTDQGARVYHMMINASAAAAAVGVFVWLLILVAGFHYRKTSDELPRQVRYNLPIEVLYTAVPFVIIAVLFYYTAINENYLNKTTAKPQVTIGVVGFQWNWQFNYVNEGLQVTGAPGTPATLILPTDRTIRFVETSPDVIHSFWVPKFLFKRDVIPGRQNTFELTIRQTGQWIGRCAELCGEKHDRMDFFVKAVSPQDYDAFVSKQKSAVAAASRTGITPLPGHMTALAPATTSSSTTSSSTTSSSASSSSTSGSHS